MENLLTKIIEMDEKARKTRKQAEKEKVQSEEEIELLRQQIYDDYIRRARERVEKNIAVDRQQAESDYAAAEQHTEELIRQMQERYAAYGDSWVDTIVKNVLG